MVARVAAEEPQPRGFGVGRAAEELRRQAHRVTQPEAQHVAVERQRLRVVACGQYDVAEALLAGDEPVSVRADHPAVLVGADHAPTPAELLLNALGACLMSGLANIAAARGIDLDEVTATVEGDINLLGILGLDDEVRNGYEAIRVVFHVKGAAEAAKLAALVEQSRRRSAVFDVVTNGVPVSIDVAAA